jgi:hypothetical protein
MAALDHRAMSRDRVSKTDVFVIHTKEIGAKSMPESAFLERAPIANRFCVLVISWLGFGCQGDGDSATVITAVKRESLVSGEYVSEMSNSRTALLLKTSESELIKMAEHLSTTDDPQFIVHDVHLGPDTFHCVDEDQQPAARMMRAQGIDPGTKKSPPNFKPYPSGAPVPLSKPPRQT